MRVFPLLGVWSSSEPNPRPHKIEVKHWSSCCVTTGSLASLKHWDAGLIPSPARGVKEPKLLQNKFKLRIELCLRQPKKKKKKKKKT